jgi:hypothetical protein
MIAESLVGHFRWSMTPRPTAYFGRKLYLFDVEVFL